MKKIFLPFIVVLLVVCCCAACRKDYIVGGTKTDVNQYANTSTYDVLKSKPLFDTLVQVIDAAGLQDKINASGTTFFAPTDDAIMAYLQARTLLLQLTVDQYAKFQLDSLLYYMKNNINGTRDSLQMYLLPAALPLSSLTNQGAKYATGLKNDTAIISYEYSKSETDGYNNQISNVPQVMYYTHLWYPYALSASMPIDSMSSDIGVHTQIQTGGIPTKNGVLNVMTSSHILFFYSTKH